MANLKSRLRYHRTCLRSSKNVAYAQIRHSWGISNSKRNKSLKTKDSSLSLETGVFYCKALASRPTGNRPDLLVTRVESWNLHLSTMIPLISKFSGTLETREGSALIDSKSPRQNKNLSSRLIGYSLLLNFDTWFGG